MNLTITQIEDICIYMNWKFSTQDMIVWEIVQGVKGGAAMLRHPLDLNDASLCVEKMVGRKDDNEFRIAVFHEYERLNKLGRTENSGYSGWDVFMWLFNPDNFFSAMAAWLRSR
jgi:hypothetical protein